MQKLDQSDRLRPPGVVTLVYDAKGVARKQESYQIQFLQFQSGHDLT